MIKVFCDCCGSDITEESYVDVIFRQKTYNGSNVYKGINKNYILCCACCNMLDIQINRHHNPYKYTKEDPNNA